MKLNNEITKKLIGLRPVNKDGVFLYVKFLETRIKKGGELHHILPKSVFPEFANLQKYSWNGVGLISADHISCHGLLIYAFPNIRAFSSSPSVINRNSKTTSEFVCNRIIKLLKVKNGKATVTATAAAKAEGSNLHSSTVARIARRADIKVLGAAEWSKVSGKLEQTVLRKLKIRNNKATVPAANVGKQVGLSECTISRVAKRNGIKTLSLSEAKIKEISSRMVLKALGVKNKRATIPIAAAARTCHTYSGAVRRVANKFKIAIPRFRFNRWSGTYEECRVI